MDKIELLAPGGSMESIYAAVQSGADAIYMGGTKFSARAYASNFNEEELIKVVNYCHLYDVKVYIAFNTLIKENEMQEAIEYGTFLYKIGVDAVITQDMGLFKVLQENIPQLEIHASTQMSIHNGEGAMFLKNIGFHRIVLSRELGIDEVKYISKDLDIETEIFVHGALCISYSGQCLMSSIIGGRSGNRGRCAQPCRLPYKLIRESTGETKEGYLLSPKDTCTIEEVKALIESGTSSLKIEGRMKKPEYVSGVVSAYREAIDGVYNKKKVDIAPKKAMLAQLFNREGFSKAYLRGNVGRDMMAYNFPKNTGIFLGKVNKDMTITLSKDIRAQDGIRTENGGFIITSIIKDNEKVKEAHKGDRVKLLPVKYNHGENLYVTSDTELMEKLHHNYDDIYGRKMPIDMKVTVEIGKPLHIVSNYRNQVFEVYGDVVEAAAKKPMDKESFIKNLSKLGDTPFEINQLDFEIFEEGFMRVSAINNARRQLVDEIYDYVKKSDMKEIDPEEHSKIPEGYNFNKHSFNSEYLVTVKQKHQLDKVLEFADLNPHLDTALGVDIFQKGSEIKLEDVEFENLYLVVPNIIKQEFEVVAQTVEKYLPSVKGIITGNMGIMNRFKGRTSIIGDYKLNIINSDGVKLFDRFTDISALSAELNSREISEVARNIGDIPVQMVVYGKYELMVSEYCVIGSTFGTKSAESSCNYGCYKDNYKLQDRMKEEFIVKTDRYCRSHIYNPVAVNLVPFIKELKKNKINNYRIDFIDESYDETGRVLEYIFNNADVSIGKTTKGHYKRGIE